MKNKEKDAKEIVEIACDGYRVAVDKRTDKIVSCKDISCSKCLFLIIKIAIEEEENGLSQSTLKSK